MEKQGPAETPDQHLETMLVGKDLRNKLNAQLQQMVVDYGQESLKEKPDELLMGSIAERMNEVGAKLKSLEGTSEAAIYRYNLEASQGADSERLEFLGDKVIEHETGDLIGRYGAAAVAHGEKSPVSVPLGENIEAIAKEQRHEDVTTDEKLRLQLGEMVVDYGKESLKEKPDELLMKSLEEQMNEIGARLASSDGTESETEPQPGFISDQQRRPGTVGSVKLPGRWRKEQDPQVQPVEGDGGGAVDAPEIVEPEPTPEPTPTPEVVPQVQPVEGDGGGAVDAPEIVEPEPTPEPTPTPEVVPQVQPVEGDGGVETLDNPEGNPFRVASAEVVQPYERDQDVTLRNDRLGLYGVFDGMGSADESRKVAEKAANILEERAGEIEDSHDVAVVKKWIEDCLGQAHNELIKELTDPYPDIIPGSTASVVKMIYDNEGKRRAVWGSVGDSRIYRISASGKIERITKDEGGIDDDLEGNIVTNMVGIPGYSFKQSGDFLLEPGDRILVMSDGITGDEERDLLSDQEIADAVNGKTAEDAAQRLIEISRKHDDKSAVIVDVLSEDGEPISRSDVIADEPEIGTTPLSDRVIHRVGGLAELRPDPESKPALEELREVAERTGQVVSSLRQVGGKMFGKYYEKAREAIGAKPPIEDIDEAGPVTKKTIPRPVRPTNTPRAKRKEGFEPSGAESDSLRPDLTVSPLGYEVTEAAAKVATDIGRANEWVGSRLRQPESVSVDSVSEPGDEISAEVAEATPEEALTVSQKALNEVIESEKRLADFNKRADRGPQNDPVVNAAKDEMRRVLEQQLTDAQLRYDKSQYFEDVKDGLDIPGWVNGDDSNPERDDIIHLERLASGESYKPGFKAVDADTAFDTLPEGIGVREMAEQSVETPEPAQASIESDGGDAAISEGSGEPLGVEKQEPLSIAEHEKAVKNLREKLDILKQATAEGTEGKDLRDAIAWLQTWDEMIWSRPADEDYEKSLRGRKKLTERLTSIIDAKAKEIPEDDQVNLDDFRVAREAIEATNAPVVAADEKAQRQHRKEKGLRRDDEDVAQRLRDNLLDLYLTSSPTTNIAQEGMNFTALRLLQVDELLGKPMSQATTDQLSAAFDFREGYTSSLIDAITREQSVLDSQAGKKNVERLQALERTLRTLKRESFPGTLGDVGHLAGEEAGKIFRRRMEGLEAFRGRVVSRIPGLRPATSNTPKEPLMGRPIWADGLDVPDWVNGNYKRPKRDELLESYGRGSKQGDERLDADAAFYTLPEGLTADSEINPEPASEPEFIETVQSPTESDGGGAATSEGPGESVEASTSDVTEIERQLGDELDAANKNNDEANSELNAWIASLNEADKERALKQIDGGQIPSQIQAAEDAYARQSEALSRRSVVVFQGLGAETGIAPDQDAGEELRRRQVSERQLLDAHLEVRTALLRATIVGDSAGAEQFLAEIRQHSDAYLDAVQQRVLAELEVSRRDGKAPFTSQAV